MVSIAPAKREKRGYEVTFGRTSSSTGLRFLSSGFRVFNSRQSLTRIGTGAAAIDRAAREDAHPGALSGFERGILPGVELKDWRQAIGYLEFNEGIQFRVGRGCLPYAVTNYAAVEDDEDISSAVANGWRRHDCVSAVGGTADVWYTGIGHKLYRDSGDGSPEVAETFTDVITCVAELVVNGARVFAVATNGNTDGIKYTTDPTADTISWTSLVALSSGDHITAMRYISTLGTGVNVIVGTVAGTGGVWWMDTATAAPWTLEPVVLTSTKDRLGSLGTSNTVTLTDIDPTTGGNEGTGTKTGTTGTGPPGSPQTGAWVAAANIVSSNDGYAVWTVVDNGLNAEQGFETSWLHASGYDISSKPPSGQFVAAEFTIEASLEDASNLTSVYGEAQLVINGSVVGTPRSFGPLTGSDALYTVGSTTDNWDVTELSGRFTIGLRIRFVGVAGDDGPSDVRVDHILLDDFVYRPLGDTVAFGKGWLIDRHNEFPERVSIVDDEGEVWHLDFVWQPDQERPTFSFTQPNEGMRNVWVACPFLDGYAYAGKNTDGPGFYLKHERPQGVLNYSFPQKHGDYEVRINGLTRADDWLILEVVHYQAGTTTVKDLQVWFFSTVPDRAFSADTLLQSLTNNLAIAAAPIPASIRLTNPAQDLMYCIFPNGTDTAFRAERVQPDLAADPLTVNTHWAKTMAWTEGDEDWAEDRPVRCRTPRMNVGPPEALKAFTVLRYGDRLVSKATGESYGSVTVEVDTGGDRTFATPEISYEFTKAYEEYQVPGGVKYQDVIFQLGVKHDAGSAESPAVCPIEWETQQKWPTEVWVAVKVMAESASDWFKFIADFQALEEGGKVTQELKIGNLRDDPADYESASSSFGALAVCEGWPDGLQPELQVPAPGEPVRFVNARGEAVEPVMLFRLVRGAVA